MERIRNTEQRVWALLEPILLASGYELVEVEYTQERGRWILRLYMDAEGGVSIADTTKVSRLIDPILDVEDPIENSYDLEVSSPGFDRPLRKPEHFARYAGEEIRLRTHEPLDVGDSVLRRNFAGILKGCTQGRVRIEVDGRIHEVPHEAIKRAHVAYRYDEERR